MSGPNITGGNIKEVLAKTETKMYTEFKVTFPGTGEYGLNVFARTSGETRLYPVFSYLIDHRTKEPDQDRKMTANVVYIVGTQVNIVYPSTKAEYVLYNFDRCFYRSDPGDSVDSSLTVTHSGMGLNFLLNVLENESYRLDVYEECFPESGSVQLKAVHRLVPLEYDKYDEAAVVEKQKKARELEAARRNCDISEFNRDAIRARLKMTLVINVLSFTEGVLDTCRYYDYTDDDLVPRVEHQALILNKKRELGIRIRQAVTTGLVLPLERILDSIEDNDIEQEMGFLLAVARNILFRKMTEKIRKMDQRTVAEVKSYSAPPRAAQEVMKASLLLMGHKTSEIEEWSSIRSLIGDTQKMKQRLKDVDIEALDYRTVKKAARLMASLTHNEVRHTSDSQNLIKLKKTRKPSLMDSSEENSSNSLKTESTDSKSKTQ
ncbi:hypothetical protein LSH36_18g05004 [Paralvinella palmiformis]|uniref:Uncharacterized protein n=1 Tax=Paralvinella palmiformis TaxID=53620 RepID=A0AAD9KBY0_9ANNE|nr:hypothetical protein LSH36_18g05004 [Paralvinella palmiformis]